MKLYIQQQIFSWNDKFTIKDENEVDRYVVEGELLSLGKKLYIYDANGNEVAFIKQKLLSFMPRFEVYMGNRLVAEIIKEITFLKPRYVIKGTNWSIEGDFWGHEYYITDGIANIANISKVWVSWGDSFELEILKDADEVLAIAIILAIDCVMDEESD